MGVVNNVLFAGGDPGPLSYLRSVDYGGSFLVAVDRGLAVMTELGLAPDLFVGDADSVPADLLAGLDPERTRIVRLSPHKDVSDLEAAFDILAAEKRTGTVLVLAGLGGRVDHALLNLQLAARRLADFESISFEDDRCQARPLRGSNAMCLAEGTIVSFVPIIGDVELTLVGFEFPLVHAWIAQGSTRTLSNVAHAGEQQVIVDRGTVMMIAWKESQTSV
jgi:thiamine pyrophosphokinase